MSRTIESSVKFHLLGPLAAEAGESPVDLGPPKQRSVLAVLLLHANEIVPTDRIIDMVWGDDPPRTAEHSVQIYISDLRKALADGSQSDLIETRPPGYVVNIPPDSLDTLQFEHLVRDGLTAVRTGDVATGRPKLEKAVASWTATPLADFAYDDFAQGYIRSLEEMRSDALEALGDIQLDLGHLEQARDTAREVIEADPLREQPRRLMILALYRAGRQAEALRHFGEYHDLLATELGIEPSESLRDLEERILLQDPTLNLQMPVAAAGNPYRGLRPFSEDDADVYFGRESLVEEVLETLREGPGFVSIVGPSGSGKSSAARAGVMPSLRAEGETVALFQPGARPLWELAGALDRAGLGSRATLLRRFESDAGALVSTVGRPVVLVVDQFEEVFTLAEPDVAVRFSELIAAGIRDPATPIKVIATLRADYYDKPLSMPALAGVFSDSVVSVKPMTPLEIEMAVVEPARAAGVDVEPALLAQMVADMGDEPGALPLLQFTLFELFERTSNALTLGDYEQLGGIHGALTGGAAELLDEFDDESRDLVEQLMMRMVQKGRALSTARPVPLRELIDLGVDRVVLQEVLEAFGSRRLITFDRDASGAAVVEMAHEYLISEWPQLANWIEEHSEDLDRLYTLESATDDWLAADRSEDYLLRGQRLGQFQAWSGKTTLRLTSTETEFIGASVEMRRREEAAQLGQSAKEAALRRSARRRLWAFGGAVAALASAVTFLVIALTPEPPPDVILVAEARVRDAAGVMRREGVFGEMIASGVDLAVEKHGLVAAEFNSGDLSQIPVVEELVSQGTGLVVLSNAAFAQPSVQSMIDAHPETWFVRIDCDPESLSNLRANEQCIFAQHDEIGFLAGVAAGLTTETNHVGIVVGVDTPFMHPFQVGYEQGVAYADPQVQVSSIYLTQSPDMSGFNSRALGNWATGVLINEDADVVFQAAGVSGLGVFDRVYQEAIDSGTPLWAIGVDADEYRQVDESPMRSSGVPVDGWIEHILTSVVKRTDLGVFNAIDHYFTTGEVELVLLSIENGGVDYVTTGGYVDDIVPVLDAAKQAIKDGSVVIVEQTVDDARMLEEAISP